MSSESSREGKVSDEIRRKVRNCRRALRVASDTNMEQLAKATVILFSIEKEALPERLRPDLAKAKQAVLGDVLALDSTLLIAEDHLRAALSSLSLLEHMQLTYSLLAFCNRCEQDGNPEEDS